METPGSTHSALPCATKRLARFVEVNPAFGNRVLDPNVFAHSSGVGLGGIAGMPARRVGKESFGDCALRLSSEQIVASGNRYSRGLQHVQFLFGSKGCVAVSALPRLRDIGVVEAEAHLRRQGMDDLDGMQCDLANAVAGFQITDEAAARIEDAAACAIQPFALPAYGHRVVSDAVHECDGVRRDVFAAGFPQNGAALLADHPQRSAVGIQRREATVLHWSSCSSPKCSTAHSCTALNRRRKSSNAAASRCPAVAAFLASTIRDRSQA